MHTPIIQTPFDPTGEIDDQTYIELCEMKGVIYLFVESQEGKTLPVTFITHGAMTSFIQLQTDNPGKYYQYHEGFILVEKIDWETMNRALELTWRSGHFKSEIVVKDL